MNTMRSDEDRAQSPEGAEEETEAVGGAATPPPERRSKYTNDGAIAYATSERTCPHCGTVGRGPVMSRWHFDNCKDKYRWLPA